MMTTWQKFLDSLNTPGGHIFILCFVFYSGVAFFIWSDATGGGQVMNLSFGALMGYLTGKKLEEIKNGKVETTITSVATIEKKE